MHATSLRAVLGPPRLAPPSPLRLGQRMRAFSVGSRVRGLLIAPLTAVGSLSQVITAQLPGPAPQELPTFGDAGRSTLRMSSGVRSCASISRQVCRPVLLAPGPRSPRWVGISACETAQGLQPGSAGQARILNSIYVARLASLPQGVGCLLRDGMQRLWPGPCPLQEATVTPCHNQLQAK